MENQEGKYAFEPLPMRQRLLTPVDSDQYSVHAASGETRAIYALTAYEAVRQSGLINVIKVERVFKINGSVYEKTRFSEVASPQAVSGKLSVADRARLDKNPIFSPEELTELVQSALRQNPALPTAAPSLDDALPSLESQTKPLGAGELLPSGHVEPRETTGPAQFDRELSADEVAKLLE